MQTGTDLGSHADDLAPAARFPQLSADRARDARAEHLALLVEQDAGVVVEADRPAVRAGDRLLCPARRGEESASDDAVSAAATARPWHERRGAHRMMTARRTSPRRTFCPAACMCAGASLSTVAIGRALETTTVTSSPASARRQRRKHPVSRASSGGLAQAMDEGSRPVSIAACNRYQSSSNRSSARGSDGLLQGCG
jgi:hypothetical protein